MTSVNVKDGNNINFEPIICLGICIDAGNNTGFFGLYIPIPPDYTIANITLNMFTIPGNAFLEHDYLYDTSWEDDAFYNFDDDWELIRKRKRQDALLKKTEILYAKKAVPVAAYHGKGLHNRSVNVKVLPVTVFPINPLPLTINYPLANS